MKKNKLSVKKGFSLMELLLVVALTLIMTGTLFVNNNSKKAATEVEAVSRQVAAQIRYLQNEAITGKKIGNDYINKFEFNSSVGSYTLEYDDANPQVFDLSKKKISFNPASNVYFNSPRGDADAPEVIILESQRDNSEKYYICVSSNGNVTESKGDPTSTCN